MIKRYSVLLVVALAGFIAALLYCSKNNDSHPGTGPSNNTPTNTLVFSASYSVSGNKIITQSYQQIHHYGYCWGDSLVVRDDTNYVKPDTFIFELYGNTLNFFIEAKTDTDFIDSTARVETYAVCTRQGSGSDLTDTWKWTSVSYQVMAGSLTPAQQQALDSMVAEKNAELAAGYTQLLEFTGTKLNVYTIAQDNNWADDFIHNWNSGGTWSDSALYNITVVKASGSSVRLTGNISGEVVTITYVMDLGEIYSSSIPANAQDTVYDDPASCPNKPPAWYQAFLQANPKGLLKAAAPALDKPRPPYSVRQHMHYRIW